MHNAAEITSAMDIISLIPPREAIWNGRAIIYRPGRLSVCLGRGTAHRTAYNLLVQVGCQIEYSSFNDGLFEVLVPPNETLRLAVELGKSDLFRYVEPDIIEGDARHH
jgi:hypothetical protein